jgi:ubiquinone/menaquinone biosynthesis C-methylase UbiE
MLTTDHKAWGYTSSSGLGFTEHGIVDLHFRACVTTYRQLLEDVGIQRGWHVLDAGCGGGTFLPWLSELVGRDGRISAIDLAEENVRLASACARSPEVRCPVDVRQANLTELPFLPASFDAVWCSNTVQYLDDDQLTKALAEMRRVVRPGGLVAVKELDARLITARPGDPYLFSDFFRAAGATPGYARQLLRSGELYRWFRRAGLTEVRQRTVLAEHFAPLSPDARTFYGRACAQIAAMASKLGASQAWARFEDPDGAANPLDDPDAYISEGNLLAVGVVPR